MISLKKTLKLAVFAFLVLKIGPANAQFMEAGFTLGGANYVGDLQNGLAQTEWNRAWGMSFRYHLNRHLVWKTGLMNAQITGHDANWRKSDPRNTRNLSFRTDLIECTTQVEISLLKYDVLDGKVTTPFVFLGLGATYFNPQAEYKGAFYDLQPLGTEGQGWAAGAKKKYNRVTMVIPMGIGFRFSLGKRTNLGFEFGFRKTFTDYLDDVSGNYPNVEKLLDENLFAAKLSYRTPELTKEPFSNPPSPVRGDPTQKDHYFIGGLTLTFNLTDKYGLEWDKNYRIYDDEIAENRSKKSKKRKRSEYISAPPPAQN